MACEAAVVKNQSSALGGLLEYHKERSAVNFSDASWGIGKAYESIS